MRWKCARLGWLVENIGDNQAKEDLRVVPGYMISCYIIPITTLSLNFEAAQERCCCAFHANYSQREALDIDCATKSYRSHGYIIAR